MSSEEKQRAVAEFDRILKRMRAISELLSGFNAEEIGPKALNFFGNTMAEDVEFLRSFRKEFHNA